MGEQRVVVQHLLEVRHQPVRVGAVAGEAAAELVVDAAIGHGVQRARHHRQDRRVAGSAPGSEQELEGHRRRELRRAAEPAVHGVEAGTDARGGGIELRSLRVVIAGRAPTAAPADDRRARRPAPRPRCDASGTRRRRRRGRAGSRPCRGGRRAGSRCRRRTDAGRASGRRSSASRPSRSWPARPPCRCRRGRGAPRGRP